MSHKHFTSKTSKPSLPVKPMFSGFDTPMRKTCLCKWKHKFRKQQAEQRRSHKTMENKTLQKPLLHVQCILGNRQQKRITSRDNEVLILHFAWEFSLWLFDQYLLKIMVTFQVKWQVFFLGENVYFSVRPKHLQCRDDFTVQAVYCMAKVVLWLAHEVQVNTHCTCS